MKKLPGISIFFPFYNDQATVEKAIHDAYTVGKKVARSVEVIAINGGNSQDNTFQEIQRQKRKYPHLKILNKKTNSIGYAVIKHGFTAATKEWIFYTDGDLQYDLNDLIKLVKKQIETGADVVNGYKIHRKDNIVRTVVGEAYRLFSKKIYKLPISDLTCDFRLMKASLLKKIRLHSKGASILLELIKKLEREGAIFVEIGVKHHKNSFRKSNYHTVQLLTERLVGDFRLRNLYNKKNENT